MFTWKRLHKYDFFLIIFKNLMIPNGYSLDTMMGGKKWMMWDIFRKMKHSQVWAFLFFEMDRDPSKKAIVYSTMGVSHCGLAIYIKKYLHAKEELWEFKYFTMQKCNLQKQIL